MTEGVSLPTPGGLLWIEKNAPYFLGWQENWDQREFITALATTRIERMNLQQEANRFAMDYSPYVAR